MQVQTLKGFRDFLPQEARKRQYVISLLKQVFERFGFDPLETPALEYEEILLGKYGAEGDKLMYRFTDNGARRVALRYDQTVPLARVVAQYSSLLVMPFKRYQIQPVWRAENTQRGRFREFLQCDIDIAGTRDLLADAEILSAIHESFTLLGFKNIKILVNDRSVFSDLSKRHSVKEEDLPEVIRAIDKLKKIGVEKVVDEIVALGYSNENATYILQAIETQQPTPMIQQLLAHTEKLGIPTEKIIFLPYLARGLDYYTGLIIEVECEDYEVGSLGGGGRYDNLIGMFTPRGDAGSTQKVPAVGFAFGFDRILEAMEILKLFPEEFSSSKVLVTIFSPELKAKSIEIASLLRSKDINTELYLDENAKMDRQMKYANNKKIPYAVIVGPDEIQQNKVTIKNLSTREQKTVSEKDLPHEIT